MRYPCCSTCRGRSPFPEICREKTCFCHVAQAARKQGSTITHRDTTANTAINNIMKGKK